MAISREPDYAKQTRWAMNRLVRVLRAYQSGEWKPDRYELAQLVIVREMLRELARER